MTRFFHFCVMTISVLILCGIAVPPANAATIEVNDSGDTSMPSACTLRDAIISINLASLQGGCVNNGASFGDSDLIDFNLPLPFNIALQFGSLVITQDMIIRSNAGGLLGAEQAIIRSAFPGRVFHIINARASIRNFTISNGFVASATFPLLPQLGGGLYATNGAELRISNSIISNNRGDIGGGIGLDMNSNVTIINSRISENRAIAGAGIGAIDTSSVYLLGASIEQNHATDIGGGIGLNNSSFARIRGSNIIGNQAYAIAEDFAGMGTVFPPTTEGGGISASNNSIVEVLEESVVGDNVALLGGGIQMTDSTLLINNSVLQDNVSSGVNSVFNDTVTFRQGFGGGLHLDSGAAEIQDTEIRTNSASSGAGIFSTGGQSIGVIQSTIASNISRNWGGGLYLTGSSNVGILNSTVSGNFAGLGAGAGIFPAGGGIYTFGAGAIQIFNTTIAANTAQNGEGGGIHVNTSQVILSNSILAGNSASFGSELSDADGSLHIISGGNLYGDSSKTFAQAMDIPFFSLLPSGNDIIASSTQRSGAVNPTSTPFADIVLPITDNGGATRTHQPASKSLVLDAGEPTVCLNITVDQRGKPRNDGLCDIGSVEVDQSACYVIKAENDNVITFCL